MGTLLYAGMEIKEKQTSILNRDGGTELNLATTGIS